MGGAKPFTRRRGSLLTDRQTGSQATSTRSFALKRPTVFLGGGGEFVAANWDFFLCGSLAFTAFLLHIRNYLRLFSLSHPPSCKRIIDRL